MIFLAHHIVERPQVAQGVGFGLYGAITEVQSLAAQH
jgi:hypothetical protein